ncbi:S8 family serine peptidase [Halioxenophilus sp. WMMB6]|uniref:S8 family serine peptidase n=1 Tax=Halioxenophilus sp. WMMB6 TaxID=3073815 RepID=UPI00295F0548|nr:S8 family serine peptidase [Halioxenophilus sp. WMMB6]
MKTRLFTAATLTVALLGGVSAQPLIAAQSDADALVAAATAKANPSVKRINERVFTPEKGVVGEQKYIVRFAEEPLATYDGSIPGLAATRVEKARKPGQRSAARLDAHSAAAQSYLSYLKQRQADMETRMDTRLGRKLEVKRRYQAVLNGMAVRMTQAEAERLSTMPGIAKIQRDVEGFLETDRGPTYIGAAQLWAGAVDGIEAKGEGVVIGVMDSGINGDHPSFAAVGGDGYEPVNPLGDGVFLGECDPGSPQYNPAIECNNKLIGRYLFIDATPTETDSEDTDGHGSHTASTAGGNFTEAPVFDAEGTPLGLTLEISGVAPHANIVALQVCAPSCFTSDRIAALDQILLDGVVDVINHSIGSNVPVNISPWEDAMALAWLSARAAGITVANSAGNNGPAPATLGSPSAPWVTNSGAFTHDRAIETKFLTGFSGGDTTPVDIEGRAVTGAYGPAAVVFAGDYSNGDADPQQCLTPFPAGTWTNGEIVMCERGAIARVDKCINVRDGGAAGCILANVPGGASSLNNDAHVIPAIHVDADSGIIIKDWLASGADHMAAITGNLVPFGADPANGAIAADFTSRGPNLSQDYLPISVGAPGVDIYAAMANGVEFGFLSGTSMASPHSAGASALLKQVHPDWTDAEILSALATTANYSGARKEDGTTPADPFDVGGGVIQVAEAASAGLLLDETVANFEAADPNLGGDPKTLNVAGMVTRACLLTCSWTRTLEATTAGDWTVSTSDANITANPASFSLAAGESQAVTISVDSTGLDDSWHHGVVVFTPAGDLPEQHLTVSYVPSSGEIPDEITATAVRDADSVLVAGLTAIEISDLQLTVSGLVAPTETALSLAGDSDNSTPFDDLGDGVYYTLLTLDEFAARLVAFTDDATSESPDVDLYVGYDVDGDGLPGAGEIVCISATATASERCDLTGVIPGNWWVLVQNWGPSATAPDALVLSTAVAGEDLSNLLVDGPVAVPELTPFDLRLIWDLPNSAPGDVFYGAIALGSDAANPGNIGTIPVTITRGEDDVSFAASTNAAMVGDSISFVAEVAPNLTPEDRTYEIIAAIPEGMTLVPESITGGGTVVGDTIVWSLAMPSLADAEPSYVAVTSEEDPACAMPFATNGGYTDLEAYGLLPDTTVTGDTVSYSAFSGQNFNFYGRSFAGGFNFTDDGFVYFDSSAGPNPWVNTSIPDSAEPNDLIAALWRDMIIPTPNATPGSVVGVTLATAGTEMTLIEYDNMELWPGGGGDSVDFGIAIAGVVDDTPGAYEIMTAFDNVNIAASFGTIGVENHDGSAGTLVAYDDVAITNGLAICYDLVAPSYEPVVLSFEATVAAGAAGTDQVVALTSSLDSVGSEAVTETEVISVEAVAGPVYSGAFVGQLSYTDEISITSRVQLLFQLFADGEPVIEPPLVFHLVDQDGNTYDFNAYVLMRRELYFYNVKARALGIGDYTVQAVVNGEVVAEDSFSIVGKRKR